MSKMFDYITDKSTGKVAALEASLEHMGGHLGVQIEENERLTNEVERLRTALQKLDGINDNPAVYNPDMEVIIRDALNPGRKT